MIVLRKYFMAFSVNPAALHLPWSDGEADGEHNGDCGAATCCNDSVQWERKTKQRAVNTICPLQSENRGWDKNGFQTKTKATASFGQMALLKIRWISCQRTLVGSYADNYDTEGNLMIRPQGVEQFSMISKWIHGTLFAMDIWDIIISYIISVCQTESIDTCVRPAGSDVTELWSREENCGKRTLRVLKFHRDLWDGVTAAAPADSTVYEPLLYGNLTLPVWD